MPKYYVKNDSLIHLSRDIEIISYLQASPMPRHVDFNLTNVERHRYSDFSLTALTFEIQYRIKSYRN